MLARVCVLRTCLNRCSISSNLNLVAKRNYKNVKRKRKTPKHWKKQSELLADMGIHVGDDPRNPDAIAQTEILDDLQDDVEDIYLKDHPGMRDMMSREEKRRKKLALYKIIERKHFKKPKEDSLLTWDAIEQIRYLSQEYPDEWTPERIAESFPISMEGARKVRSKTWRPRYIEEVISYDKRVQKRWLELKSAGEKEGGPITNRYKQLLEDGQLGLLKNAAGYAGLPMPEKIALPSRYSRNLNRDPDKPPGPWASIVHDYCELRDNLTGKNPNLITKGKYLHVPGKNSNVVTKGNDLHVSAKEQQQHKDEQTRLLEDITSTILQIKQGKKAAEKKGKQELRQEQSEEKQDKEVKKSFQGWFRFDKEDDKVESPTSHKEAEPTTMLQSATTEGVKQQRELPRTSLRRNSTLRRRKVSLPAEIAQQRSIQNILCSDDNLEDMAVMFRKDYKVEDSTVTPVSEETDPGLAGTKKILSKGVSYKELMKPVRPDDKYAFSGSSSNSSPFPDRRGAYGYFRDETVDKRSEKRSARNEMLETIEHNEKQDGQPYYYDEETGTYQYPYGRKLESVQTNNSSEPIYKKGNEFYDETGQFLFKTPESDK